MATELEIEFVDRYGEEGWLDLATGEYTYEGSISDVEAVLDGAGGWSYRYQRGELRTSPDHPIGTERFACEHKLYLVKNDLREEGTEIRYSQDDRECAERSCEAIEAEAYDHCPECMDPSQRVAELPWGNVKEYGRCLVTYDIGDGHRAIGKEHISEDPWGEVERCEASVRCAQQLPIACAEYVHCPVTDELLTYRVDGIEMDYLREDVVDRQSLVDLFASELILGDYSPDGLCLENGHMVGIDFGEASNPIEDVVHVYPSYWHHVERALDEDIPLIDVFERAFEVASAMDMRYLPTSEYGECVRENVWYLRKAELPDLVRMEQPADYRENRERLLGGWSDE